MLHQNDYVQREIARQHQERLLREARVARFRGGPREGQLSYHQRLLVSIAELLINIGKKLKARYQPWYLESLHELALTNKE